MDEENNGGGVQYINYDLKNYLIREVRYMSRVFAGKLNGQQLLWTQVPNGWPEHLKWKNPTSTPKDNVDELREKFEFLRKNIQLSDSLRERLHLFDRKNLKAISFLFYLESFSETLKNFHSVDTEEPLIQERLKNVLIQLQKVQEIVLPLIGAQSCKRKVTNVQAHDTPMKKHKPDPNTEETHFYKGEENNLKASKCYEQTQTFSAPIEISTAPQGLNVGSQKPSQTPSCVQAKSLQTHHMPHPITEESNFYEEEEHAHTFMVFVPISTDTQGLNSSSQVPSYVQTKSYYMRNEAESDVLNLHMSAMLSSNSNDLKYLQLMCNQSDGNQSENVQKHNSFSTAENIDCTKTISSNNIPASKVTNNYINSHVNASQNTEGPLDELLSENEKSLLILSKSPSGDSGTWSDYGSPGDIQDLRQEVSADSGELLNSEPVFNNDPDLELILSNLSNIVDSL